MRARAAFGRVFATLALVAAFAAEAPAQHAACIQDGEIVTFDGVATSGARIPNASRSAWVLNLRRPICVLRNIPFSPGPIQEAISAIRIIGTPPPLGVPLQLTGKLLLGRSAPDATLFVALEVIHGRKNPCGGCRASVAFCSAACGRFPGSIRYRAALGSHPLATARDTLRRAALWRDANRLSGVRPAFRAHRQAGENPRRNLQCKVWKFAA